MDKKINDFYSQLENKCKDRFAKTQPRLLIKLTKYEIVAYSVLAMMAGSTGYCFASPQTVEKETGMDISDARKAFKSLLEKSIISTPHEGRGVKKYFVYWLKPPSYQGDSPSYQGDSNKGEQGESPCLNDAEQGDSPSFPSCSPNVYGGDSALKETILIKEKRYVAFTCDDSQNSLQDGKEESSHTVESVKGEIEKVYKAYPTVCPVTGKRTGKSSKDKIKIKTLLKTHTSDELLKIIELYVLEVKRDGFKQIKNFKTFLNNLPDYGEELETIGAHGVEGLSFAEGEIIEIEKLNRLYKPNDDLIVWGISFSEHGEYGDYFVSVTSVKDLNINLKAKTVAYKFLNECSLGGKVIKPYRADNYRSLKHELDTDHLKIEEVENYFEEQSGKHFYSEDKHYVRALLFRGEADVWLCKELIDFILKADRDVLDSDIFAPANFTQYLDAYENKDTTVIEKEKEQRIIAEAQAEARAQMIAEARAKEKAEAEKAKAEAEKAKKAQAEEKAKDIEKEKKRRLMNDAREVNQHYTKKTEKQLPDELKKAIKTAIFDGDLDAWDCMWLIDYTLKHKNVSLSPELFNLSTYNSLYEESEKEQTSQ